MSQTNNPVNSIPAKIKIKSSTKFYLTFLSLVNRGLVFLNLKDAEHLWGIVYDSVSKQPLDPVILKLVYTDRREVESCVTDLAGRYGFLAEKGTFKILARKTNYTFPSQIITGKRDGIYENIYRSEFFSLEGADEVVAPNIPMDPENPDWNQSAKKKILSTHPHWKFFIRRLIGIFFWFGVILCFLELFNPHKELKFYYFIAPSVFTVILLSAATLPEPRLWGKVIIKGDGQILGNVSLELYKEDLPGICFGRAKVNQNGKFLLRSNKGKYLLSIKVTDTSGKTSLLSQLPVKVRNIGVLNDAIILGF